MEVAEDDVEVAHQLEQQDEDACSAQPGAATRRCVVDEAVALLGRQGGDARAEEHQHQQGGKEMEQAPGREAVAGIESPVHERPQQGHQRKVGREGHGGQEEGCLMQAQATENVAGCCRNGGQHDNQRGIATLATGTGGKAKEQGQHQLNDDGHRIDGQDEVVVSHSLYIHIYTKA